MSNKNIYLKIILNFILMWSLGEVCVSARVVSIMQKDLSDIKQAIYSLPYEDCGSLYDIRFLNISSCGVIPCQMLRGTTVLVNVMFNDNGNDTKYLRNHVRWIFNAIKTNALISPDPCDGNIECISAINDKKSYRTKLFVSNNLPIVRGIMRWEAVNKYGTAVLCFKVPVTIRN